MAEQTERPSMDSAAPEAPAAGTARQVGSGRGALPWVLAAGAFALAVVLWHIGSARVEARSRGASADDARRAAREREIARMIATLDDVREATVLIGGAENPGGASVSLDMRQDRALSADTASAVAGLVASAVPGLEPEDVVVVDSRDAARTYTLSNDTGAAGEGAAALRLRRDVESALADKLRSLFAGMHIDCVAVVSAEIDLDRVKEHLVEVDPKETGGAVIRDERSYAAPGEAREGETRKTEFDVSRTTQEVTKAVGSLANVRASVVYFDRRTQNADGTWSYDTTVRDNLEAYKKLAVRALGLGEYDDSAVEIQYMPSATAEPAVEGVSTRWPDILAWAAGAVATALALAALAGVAVALARMARRRAGPGREAPAQAREEEPGLPASEKLRRDVARAAASDVGRAAAILRRWMAREG